MEGDRATAGNQSAAIPPTVYHAPGGGRGMRVINVIGGVIVLLANLIVSYNHSIELFQSGGFNGWMAHVAVIGAETTFILGALNIVVARLRGESPGGPAILGGLLGVALVSWSNVSAGWEYGSTGILLGLATPASLIVAEAILSRAIIRQRKAESPSEVEAAEETSPPEKEESPEVMEQVVEQVEPSADPVAVALEVMEKEGKPPGRKKLMELARCTEWEARKALAALKEGMA